MHLFAFMKNKLNKKKIIPWQYYDVKILHQQQEPKDVFHEVCVSQVILSMPLPITHIPDYNHI